MCHRTRTGNNTPTVLTRQLRKTSTGLVWSCLGSAVGCRPGRRPPRTPIYDPARLRPWHLRFFYSFFSVRVGFSEAAKPRLRSSRTAAVRLGIRCRNLKSSMALSSSSGMATCRRAIRSGLDVICRIGLPTSQESIREVRKTRHPSNLGLRPQERGIIAAIARADESGCNGEVELTHSQLHISVPI